MDSSAGTKRLLVLMVTNIANARPATGRWPSDADLERGVTCIQKSIINKRKSLRTARSRPRNTHSEIDHEETQNILGVLL
jgi:hypothetical protein